MTPEIKVGMLNHYKNYQDVINYFVCKFPKVLAKKMFDIGEGSYNFTLNEINTLLSIEDISSLDIHDYYLITVSLGYSVKKGGSIKDTNLTFYL